MQKGGRCKKGGLEKGAGFGNGLKVAKGEWGFAKGKGGLQAEGGVARGDQGCKKGMQFAKGKWGLQCNGVCNAMGFAMQ